MLALQLLCNGIVTGCALGIVAVSFSFIYATTKIFHVAHAGVYTMGGYVADDWKVTDRLTVSLNLRLEHYANPSCDANCFSRLTTAFTGAPNPLTGRPYVLMRDSYANALAKGGVTVPAAK